MQFYFYYYVVPTKGQKSRKFKSSKGDLESFMLKIQSNLVSLTTLGTEKKWPLYIGGLFNENYNLKLVLPGLGWPLLTGGHYSGLEVFPLIKTFRNIIWHFVIKFFYYFHLSSSGLMGLL
jgi:hypothetical protein